MQEHLTGRSPIFRHHPVKYSSCWGRCREALPRLEGGAAHRADKDPKYRVSMATARCAMSLDDSEAAEAALFRLHRDFQGDPEDLFTTTHFFSELATRASQELAARAPASQQAQKFEAEGFESQGKWDEATAQYKEDTRAELGRAWNSLSIRANLSGDVAPPTEPAPTRNLRKS